jgi:septal ring factor EnvC (AmiA/AmiB activator)
MDIKHSTRAQALADQLSNLKDIVDEHKNSVQTVESELRVAKERLSKSQAALYAIQDLLQSLTPKSELDDTSKASPNDEVVQLVQLRKRRRRLEDYITPVMNFLTSVGSTHYEEIAQHLASQFGEHVTSHQVYKALIRIVEQGHTSIQRDPARRGNFMIRPDGNEANSIHSVSLPGTAM